MTVPLRTATVFLDRDGVINRKMPDGRYVTRWSEFAFLPGAREALRLLAEHNVLTIVLTNQRCLATGVVTRDTVDLIHAKMRHSAAEVGGHIDDVLVCDHDADTCDCRKPRPGLFLRARERYPSIEFGAATAIGDSASDLEPAHALGCRVVLVGSDARRRAENERLASRGITPLIAPTLLDAVREHVVASAGVA